jgi:acyl carrier protein
VSRDADVSNVVSDVLRAVLSPEDARRAAADPNYIGLWDSLQQIELLFTLEQELGVRFSAEQMQAATSPSALTRIAADVRLGSTSEPADG